MAEPNLKLVSNPPRQNFHTFQQQTANSAGPQWYGALTEYSLREVLETPGFFDTVAGAEFRAFDRIDITASINEPEPEHAVLIVFQPHVDRKRGLHIEVRRWL